MIKSLVIGNVPNQAHEETVRSYFTAKAAQGAVCHIAMIGIGTPSGNVVTYQSNMADCVQYAINNGYTCVIRSYTNVWSFKLEWDYAYKNGLAIYCAHGSNSYVELSQPPILFSAITCGGGIEANIRSYGVGLEFFDAADDGNTFESNTTPTIGAKLENIRETLACTKWEARYRARQTASGNGAWNKFNGYGRPNQAGAIAWTGTVPKDIYIALTAPDVIFNRRNYSKTHLVWNEIANVAGYKIYRRDNILAEWYLIANTTELEYEDNVSPKKAYCYKVSAYNEYEEIESGEIIIAGRRYEYELRKEYYA